ncbi:unnamed protein product [Lampetra planeri]
MPCDSPPLPPSPRAGAGPVRCPFSRRKEHAGSSHTERALARHARDEEGGEGEGGAPVASLYWNRQLLRLSHSRGPYLETAEAGLVSGIRATFEAPPAPARRRFTTRRGGTVAQVLVGGVRETAALGVASRCVRARGAERGEMPDERNDGSAMSRRLSISLPDTALWCRPVSRATDAGDALRCGQGRIVCPAESTAYPLCSRALSQGVVVV